METYPSQARYFASHPVVSFRLKKEERERLVEIAEREGKTLGQYVRDFLHGIIAERANEDAIFSRGYRQGKKDWGIWFYCAVCGKPIMIRPNSEGHEAVIELFKMNGWGHSSCIDEE